MEVSSLSWVTKDYGWVILSERRSQKKSEAIRKNEIEVRILKDFYLQASAHYTGSLDKQITMHDYKMNQIRKF